MRFIKFLANQIADAIRAADKTQQRTLLGKANDLDNITEAVAIQSPAGGDYHLVTLAARHFVRQSDFAVLVDKLEKMTAQCERGARKSRKRKGDEAFGRQQSLGLDRDIGEKGSKFFHIA